MKNIGLLHYLTITYFTYGLVKLYFPRLYSLFTVLYVVTFYDFFSFTCDFFSQKYLKKLWLVAEGFKPAFFCTRTRHANHYAMLKREFFGDCPVSFLASPRSGRNSLCRVVWCQNILQTPYFMLCALLEVV